MVKPLRRWLFSMSLKRMDGEADRVLWQMMFGQRMRSTLGYESPTRIRINRVDSFIHSSNLINQENRNFGNSACPLTKQNVSEEGSHIIMHSRHSRAAAHYVYL